MDWLNISIGDAPLIISIPHAGTTIPQEIDGLVSRKNAIMDADFYIDRLYDFAKELGATIIKTEISRTVIDVNRNPDGRSLYPGLSVTELCPTSSFDNSPLYEKGGEPNAFEILQRQKEYYTPYHSQIKHQIQRLRAKYSNIVLYDAHSIKSRVPRFFDGELPLYNLGTNDGKSCDTKLSDGIIKKCPKGQYVLDGRFKGGFITRNYGAPVNGVHAIQMELAMRGYLDESTPFPPSWQPELAKPCQTILKSILEKCILFAKS